MAIGKTFEEQKHNNGHEKLLGKFQFSSKCSDDYKGQAFLFQFNLISPFVGRNSLHSGNSSKKVFVNMPSPRLHAVIGDDPEGLTHGGRDQLGI